MNTRQALEASLAMTPAKAARTVKQRLEHEKNVRMMSRHARDAALFIERGQVEDAGRALEKAALLFLEIKESEGCP